MGLTIEDQRFLNLGLGEVTPTSYPSDNVGDVVSVEIDVRKEEYVLSTTADLAETALIAIVVYPNADLTGGVIPYNRHLYTTLQTGFEDFKKGDEVTVINSTNGNTYINTIDEVISGQLLQMTSTFSLPADTRLGIGSIAYVSTKIQSIEFKDNLIENDEAFNTIDKTTGNTRRARVEGLDNTVTSPDITMLQLGDKAYQYGEISATGNLIGQASSTFDVSQAFTVKRTLGITPIFTADQINNIKSRIAPAYLIDNNSLKYVYQIELSKDLNNPNDVKTIVQQETKGATGFFGENLNTGIKDYTISDVSYRRPDASVIESIELTTNEVIVEFYIDSVRPVFLTGSTKLVFNHAVLHANEDEYRLPQYPDPDNTYPARDRLFKANMLWDRIECTLGTPATTSDNNGGDDQIIKDCTTTEISSSRVKVEATIEMAAAALARISDIPDLDYLLWVSTADHSLTRAKSDKTSPIVDIQPYFVETSDPYMVLMTIGHIDHPSEDIDTDQKTSLVARPGDDIATVLNFTLDRNDVTNYERAEAAIDFINITPQIIAKKGSESFILEGETIPLETEITIDATYGTVPYVNYEKDRGFSSPVDDLRKNTVVRRRSDLDAGGVFAYEAVYPWIFKWSAWEFLANVPNDFLDPTAPANEHQGKNNDWAHYFTGDWDLYTRFVIKATKDGVIQTYEAESLVLVEDDDEGNEWDTEVTTTYRTDGTSDPIVNGGTYGIMGDVENTLVRGEMTYIGLDAAPVLADLVMVQMVNIYEGTSSIGSFIISSKYDKTGTNNPWIGLLGILTATKSNVSTVFRVESEIKKDSFAPGVTLRARHRFYDIRDESGVPNGMATEEPILMETEDGIIMDVESV